MVKKVALGQVLLSLFSKYYSADTSYSYFITEIEQIGKMLTRGTVNGGSTAFKK